MTSRMLGAREIEAEARRVLRRLVDPKAVLAAAGDQTKFGVFTSRNKWQRPVMQIPGGFIAAFRSREFLDLLEHDHPGALAGSMPRFQLSAIGHAFLRRSLGGADPYAAQHRNMATRTIRDDQNVGRRLSVNAAETPLGWLRSRKGQDGAAFLSEAEYEAGERLREDFTKAGLTSRVTADWSLAPGTAPKRGGAKAGQLEMTDMALAARQRFFKALDAAGPGLSDVLVEVCCHLHGLEDAERGLGWPKRSAKLVLKIALTRLAQHYGLVAVESRAGWLRSWRSPA